MSSPLFTCQINVSDEANNLYDGWPAMAEVEGCFSSVVGQPSMDGVWFDERQEKTFLLDVEDHCDATQMFYTLSQTLNYKLSAAVGLSGRPPTRRSAVQSPVFPICMPKCLLTRYWTPKWHQMLNSLIVSLFYPKLLTCNVLYKQYLIQLKLWSLLHFIWHVSYFVVFSISPWRFWRTLNLFIDLLNYLKSKSTEVFFPHQLCVLFFYSCHCFLFPLKGRQFLNQMQTKSFFFKKSRPWQHCGESCASETVYPITSD